MLITKPMALLMERLVKPFAEFRVKPEPANVIVPDPVWINWHEKPMGKVLGIVTVTAVEELIKNNLLLSAAVTEKLVVLLASITNPPVNCIQAVPFQ